MIDERKVKLMTRMASYEAGEGNEDLKVSGYYRKDYTSLHTLLAIIWGTIGFVALAGLLALALFDVIIAAFSTELILLGAVCIGGAYLVTIIIYAASIHVYYSKKHQKARLRVKKYNHNLVRLLKIYEKEK